MKHFLLLILLALFSLPAAAQDIEYGKTSELKDVKKIFIDCGANIKSRNIILKEIENSKIPVEILDSEEGAEVIVFFQAAIDEIVAGNKNSVGTVKRKAGFGVVYVPKGERHRVLLSFDDIKKTVFEKKPETNFAKAFIKAYKEANK